MNRKVLSASLFLAYYYFISYFLSLLGEIILEKKLQKKNSLYHPNFKSSHLQVVPKANAGGANKRAAMPRSLTIRRLYETAKQSPKQKP